MLHCKLPPLRPIRSEEELKQATQLAFLLSESAETKELSQDESDYLEVLFTLIEQFEEQHYPIRTLANPLDRLRYLVEQTDMSASDLGRLLGNRALGSKLLTGEREMSKAHIRLLAEHFKVEPGLFL